MCDYCRQTPCDYRCPNAEEPKSSIKEKCCNCSDYIDDDYTYWIDNEYNKFCSRECAHEYYGLQEVDE